MPKNDKFEHWFNNDLVVRAYPNLLDLNNKYIIGESQIIINVSDYLKPEIYSKIRELGIEYFWFPMNENSSDIGLHSIYGACVILRNAEIENKTVLLHCHSGNNRSQTVAQAYYYLRTKRQIINEYKGFKNQLVYNCETGHLPPLVRMNLFLKELDLKLTKNVSGGAFDSLMVKKL